MLTGRDQSKAPRWVTLVNLTGTRLERRFERPVRGKERQTPLADPRQVHHRLDQCHSVLQRPQFGSGVRKASERREALNGVQKGGKTENEVELAADLAYGGQKAGC